MKNITCLLLFIGSAVSAQITMEVLQDSTVRKYHLGASTYFDAFMGKAGYGAGAILTVDGGGAAFGDGDEGTMLVKLDKTGKEQWKRIVKPKGEEIESQSVVQDKNGNYYIFQLVYDEARFKYRGGCERVVFFNKSGTMGWDKFIGTCSQVNNPTVSYIKFLPDGRIYLRGHIVTKAPLAGKDPDTRFWEGWMNSAGALTQKSGEVIDWGKPEWQKKFKPE